MSTYPKYLNDPMIIKHIENLCPDGPNWYTCTNKECKAVTVTRHADKGITPATIDCPKCNSVAASSWYKAPDNQDPDKAQPTHEWYRIDDKAYQAIHHSMQAHHKMGGLMLRAIK